MHAVPLPHAHDRRPDTAHALSTFALARLLEAPLAAQLLLMSPEALRGGGPSTGGRPARAAAHLRKSVCGVPCWCCKYAWRFPIGGVVHRRRGQRLSASQSGWPRAATPRPARAASSPPPPRPAAPTTRSHVSQAPFQTPTHRARAPRTQIAAKRGRAPGLPARPGPRRAGRSPSSVPRRAPRAGAMIRFILLQNRAGKTRLAKYYVPVTDSEKRKLEYDVHRLIVGRDPKHTNFVEVRHAAPRPAPRRRYAAPPFVLRACRAACPSAPAAARRDPHLAATPARPHAQAAAASGARARTTMREPPAPLATTPPPPPTLRPASSRPTRLSTGDMPASSSPSVRPPPLGSRAAAWQGWQPLAALRAPLHPPPAPLPPPAPRPRPDPAPAPPAAPNPPPGVDASDNELVTLESVHLFVEILDHFFSNVCELDLVFNFHKVGVLAAGRGCSLEGELTRASGGARGSRGVRQKWRAALRCRQQQRRSVSVPPACWPDLTPALPAAPCVPQVYLILDEMIMAGEMEESSKKVGVAARGSAVRQAPSGDGVATAGGSDAAVGRKRPPHSILPGASPCLPDSRSSSSGWRSSKRSTHEGQRHMRAPPPPGRALAPRCRP
jgi:hypothetical protein